MAKERQQSFIKGAAILSGAMLFVKVLGLLFSLPLANTISTRGMSYFYTAYDIFGLFLILSTAGLPIAVSRMVGTAYSQGRKKEADKVFFVAFWLFFIIGVIGALIMCIFSREIAMFMGNEDATTSIIALSPTMFFISVMSALRGYFQGRSNMVPTAVSQIIEATTKVVIGVGLAIIILNRTNSDELASVGAITGVSISAGLGTLYLVIYKFRQTRIDKKIRVDEPDSDIDVKGILKSLIVFAIPITIGSCFLTFLDTVDSAVLMMRLKDAAGFSQAGAEDLKGLLGHARKFFDLPGAFVVPISTSLLPVLSAAIANRDKLRTNAITLISMRVTFLISIPASVGMIIFAGPICDILLLNKPEAAVGTAPLLAAMSIAILFNSTLFTTNAILQSFGKTTLPVVNMAIGGVVKLALSYILVGIPEINAMGSSISTAVSYGLIMILNIIAVNKCVPKWGGFWRNALPPIGASVVMGGISYGCYYLLAELLGISSKIAVIIAICIAIVVYVIAAVVFRAVKYEDVAMLPKGTVMARLLKLKPSDNPEDQVDLNAPEELDLSDEPVIDASLEENSLINQEIASVSSSTKKIKDKPRHYR